MKRELHVIKLPFPKNTAALEGKKQFIFMKFLKLYTVICFLFTAQASFGQTTYDWLSSAPDGNWKRGASGAARWNPGGLWDNPTSGTGAILRFNNNTFTTMTNNVSGTYIIHKIIFGSSATSSRTIGGNAVQFFEFGSTWPRIQNDATNTTHTINFPITASSNSGFNMELASYSGALIFGGTINNNGRVIQIYGDNTARDAINRYVSSFTRLFMIT